MNRSANPEHQMNLRPVVRPGVRAVEGVTHA